ncbi:hypothetical protein C2E20_0676 [Micractinium conductrix]|uniref:Uncharacterized protein n=1 Tax=Micractinium conductrix TaxID=554055 RepID=A0A2P6VQG1_9CHLO|nr:hypothetical protein C2E20_0676 [Micractinium conductrix]|eukprot:PSC76311.1 hypothetical protein C2E20_0676 [Micractinium conductrix]
MSWVPPSGSFDPQSRTAPRPAASRPIFSFGKDAAAAKEGGAQQTAALPASISQRPERANFDPPAEQLKWWKQPRSVATVSGTANSDVEAFWVGKGAQPGAMAELCNTAERTNNKAQGTGSTVKRSLGNPEEFNMLGATSAYKADLCSVHVPVGKRGVALAPEYMAAYEESKRAAQRNKQVGKQANMSLAIFETD